VRPLAALLFALALGSCRDGDACVIELRNTCLCDPIVSNMDSCVAAYEFVGCTILDAAVTDPCVVNNCCTVPLVDAAMPTHRDLSVPPPPDMSASAPPDLAGPGDAATDGAPDR
jgi:hypothetical protein